INTPILDQNGNNLITLWGASNQLRGSNISLDQLLGTKVGMDTTWDELTEQYTEEHPLVQRGNTILIGTDYTIAAGTTIVIPAGVTLKVAAGVTLTNNGTLDLYGALVNQGSVQNKGIANLYEQGQSSGQGSWSGSALMNHTLPSAMTVGTKAELDAALLQVKAGGTITLTGNIAGDFTIGRKSITLAGGNFTLTGNLVLGASGARVHDLTVAGNITVAESVGNGDVTLQQVTISGGDKQLIVKGGGAHSIHLQGVILPGIELSAINDVARITISDSTVAAITISSGGTIEINGTAVGTMDVRAGAGDVVVISGPVTTLHQHSGQATLAANATAGAVTVSGGTLAIGGTANNVTVNGGAATISGEVSGTVAVNGGDVTISGTAAQVNATGGNTTIGGTVAQLTASTPTAVSATGTVGSVVLTGAALTLSDGANVQAVTLKDGSTLAGGGNAGMVTVAANANVVIAPTVTVAAATLGAGAKITVAGSAVNNNTSQASQVPANILNLTIQNGTVVKATPTATFSIVSGAMDMSAKQVTLQVQLSGAPQGLSGYGLVLDYREISAYLIPQAEIKIGGTTVQATINASQRNMSWRYSGTENIANPTGVAVVAEITFAVKRNLYLPTASLRQLRLSLLNDTGVYAYYPSGSASVAEITHVTLSPGQVSLSACGTPPRKDNEIAVGGVQVNQDSLKLKVGETAVLTAKMRFAHAGDGGFSWKSSDNTIATVSSSGTVTAKSPGKATITVTTADGNYRDLCTVTVAAGKASMENFVLSGAAFPFSDVPRNRDHWVYPAVYQAYQLGLMQGNSATTFDPGGLYRVSEALMTAARLHHLYQGGDGKIETPALWYQAAVAYCLDNGIINKGDFKEYDRNITRAEMAYIFANALPQGELAAINTVNVLPDTTANTLYGESILGLYRAGVLTGNDGQGTFYPQHNIMRREAAAIISRMALPGQRLSFTLIP
ncbi:MAG: Ig-like domain-containing protein, partial [Clostridiales bacterium]